MSELKMSVPDVMDMMSSNDTNEIGFRLFEKVEVTEEDWKTFYENTKNSETYKKFPYDFADDFPNIVERLEKDCGIIAPDSIRTIINQMRDDEYDE